MHDRGLRSRAPTANRACQPRRTLGHAYVLRGSSYRSTTAASSMAASMPMKFVVSILSINGPVKSAQRATPGHIPVVERDYGPIFVGLKGERGLGLL